MWLDAAVRTGLPGLAVFVLLVGCCVMFAVAAVQRWRSEDGDERFALAHAVAVGCLASLAAGLAHGWVDSGYFLADLAWCLALVAGWVQNQRDRVLLDGCDIMVG
jgi:O-antigen ligase